MQFRHFRLCLLVTLMAGMSGVCSADDDKEGGLTATDNIEVFVSSEGGYHTYRIPALLLTKNGTLLAFCEARKDNRSDRGNIDLVLRRSADGGRTWGPVELVHEEGGDSKTTIGNPCPVVDQSNGRIWLPLTRNNDKVLMLSSDDEGKTWTEPLDITSSVKLPNWTWYATGPGVGIQLKQGKHAGRLMIPCDHRTREEGKTSYSHVFYSDDHGKTWQLGGSAEKHTNECQVVELHSGELLLNMRNHWNREAKVAEKGGKRAIATSSDGGATWSPVRFDETLIEPVCQASLIRINNEASDSDTLVFSNPASIGKRRHRMTVRLSTDGGKTWPNSLLIHERAAGYSSLAQLPSGEVGCLYECGETETYETISFQRIGLNTLKSVRRE